MKSIMKARRSGRIISRTYGITSGRAKRMIRNFAKRNNLPVIRNTDGTLEIETDNVDMFYHPEGKYVITWWWNGTL